MTTLEEMNQEVSRIVRNERAVRRYASDESVRERKRLYEQRPQSKARRKAERYKHREGRRRVAKIKRDGAALLISEDGWVGGGFSAITIDLPTGDLTIG